jgi:hypothetical protein
LLVLPDAGAAAAIIGDDSAFLLLLSIRCCEVVAEPWRQFQLIRLSLSVAGFAVPAGIVG